VVVRKWIAREDWGKKEKDEKVKKTGRQFRDCTLGKCRRQTQQQKRKKETYAREAI
jgi:hypothetical protein